jgi:hypothetical protein
MAARTSRPEPRASAVRMAAVHRAAEIHAVAFRHDAMNPDHTAKPRMMPIENFQELGPVGVLKPYCTTPTGRTRALAVSPQTSLQPGPARAKTSTESSYERGQTGGNVIGGVEPLLMNALLRNEPDYIRRLAFDVEDLRRRSERIAEFPDVDVHKEALNRPTSPVDMLELRLVAPFPVSLRLDRLLATELKLSRARVEKLAASDVLRISTGGVRTLRRRVKDQTIVEIDADASGMRLIPLTQGDL